MKTTLSLTFLILFSTRLYVYAADYTEPEPAGPADKSQVRADIRRDSIIPRLEGATLREVQTVKDYIHSAWPSTIRSSSSANSTTEIVLPKPFTVPTAGGMFRSFYYWDSYFTSIGLVRDGRVDIACNNAENMFYLIEKLGFVPNFNSIGQDFRSQPPVTALQVELCLPYITDHQWRERAYRALEKEYAFWMTFRAFPNGLNHYGNHATPIQLEKFGRAVQSRLPGMPEEPVLRGRFGNHAIAVAESGWDFSPRWDDRCHEFASVDLNSLLCVTERIAGNLAKELDNGQEKIWRNRLSQRLATMRHLMWSKELGVYNDYDETNKCVSKFISAASYFPLFCSIANAEEVSSSVRALAPLETPFGLNTAVAGARRQTYQWDSPNLWPPLQWVAVQGLLANGNKDDAIRIARKYVATVTRNYIASHQLWEKYNANTGTIEVRDEYSMPPMMGWTAGTFLACCQVAGY